MSANKKKKKEKKELLRRRLLERRRAASQSQKDGPVFIPTPRGEAKMSEVLWEFVEPYLETTHNEQSLRQLLDLALLCWNVAVFPPDEREGVVRDMMSKLPVDLRTDLAACLSEMVQRKEALFGDNTRMMLSYELTFTPNGPYLQVASTLLVS